MAIPLYIATLLGGVGLVLMMPRGAQRRFNLPAVIGAVAAAAGLGLVWLVAAALNFQGIQANGLGGGAFPFYYVFSAIAIAAAVRVITHTKPVYAALWFVLTVLASAGLFLTLSAEFMAFAVILIYAGAILVTYMFVIMLASQNQDVASAGASDQSSVPVYETQAYEPIAAVAAGFFLLAVLLSVAFDGSALPAGAVEPALSDATIQREILAKQQWPQGLEMPDASPQATTNVERVGLDLFMANPLAIELAGVILLVSLVGAVVIAKKQVPQEADHVAPSTPIDLGHPDDDANDELIPDAAPA